MNRVLGTKLCAALAGAGLAVIATTAVAAELTATATVQIVTGTLGVTAVDSLNFGGVEAGDTNGTVTVDVDNVRTFTPGAIIQGANFHRAEFTVTGPGGTAYTIHLPVSVNAEETEQTAERDASEPEPGISSLRVVNLVAKTVETGATSVPGDTTVVGLLSAAGTDTVHVGGTLEVVTSAKKGSFRGDIDLFVTF